MCGESRRSLPGFHTRLAAAALKLHCQRGPDLNVDTLLGGRGWSQVFPFRHRCPSLFAVSPLMSTEIDEPSCVVQSLSARSCLTKSKNRKRVVSNPGIS